MRRSYSWGTTAPSTHTNGDRRPTTRNLGSTLWALSRPTRCCQHCSGSLPTWQLSKRLIIERTEGNPFFMEEMYQAMLEDGVIARNGAVKLVETNAIRAHSHYRPGDDGGTH